MTVLTAAVQYLATCVVTQGLADLQTGNSPFCSIVQQILSGAGRVLLCFSLTSAAGRAVDGRAVKARPLTLTDGPRISLVCSVSVMFCKLSPPAVATVDRQIRWSAETHSLDQQLRVPWRPLRLAAARARPRIAATGTVI
jgi:hypothetical protein